MNPIFVESAVPVFILLSVIAAIMFVSKEARHIRRDSEVESGTFEPNVPSKLLKSPVSN